MEKFFDCQANFQGMEVVTLNVLQGCCRKTFEIKESKRMLMGFKLMYCVVDSDNLKFHYSELQVK
ncbi:hypothetical protein EDM52_24305 [Brevibacillus invocatus]|uniref:Uncharacterized protein n=1 Tax=Brevibacillus invocatus TaxID=173959 RepID=A0A3M8BGL5_9BACL|nr:hypothetical protein EDM52_24305 [Brevibacillus invocatus]